MKVGVRGLAPMMHNAMGAGPMVLIPYSYNLAVSLQVVQVGSTQS
jgi:hypothetical protein